MDALTRWLQTLGLERFAGVFSENEVDLDTLRVLSEAELEQLGLPFGPRKKLMRALQALGEPAHPQAPLLRVVEGHADLTAEAPHAERRQLTVMFCDLVGSTQLAGQLDPEELRELMRAYQGACGEVVARFEGHVAQYLGDGLMVYFGWPKAHENDAERAVRAALDIVGAVKTVHALQPLQVRIGVATGPVVVGETGAGDASIPKMAVGGTPNLAARVQGLAGADEIVIAPTTQRLLGAAFELEDRGERMLRGIVEPVRTYRVRGASAVQDRFETSHGAHVLPLVGRDSELTLLMERWRQAVEGEGQVLVLCGEPGVGKSRIARALRARLEGEPHGWIQYQCSPFFTNTAFYPVIAQIKSAAGFLEEEAIEAKLDKLTALLEPSGGPVKEALPLLAELLSLPGDGRFAPLALSPRRQKERTIEAIIEQLERVAVRAPLVLVFEDMHWLDPTTRELVDHLVHRSAALPALLLFTHRPEFDPPWGAHAHVTLHSLNRLSKRQCAQLVAGVASKPLPDALIAQIVEKTDGVPLFVEELTKAVLESGLLYDAGERYELVGALGDVRIPATLQDSLMARLDQLNKAKAVVQMGAVIGREFGYELLAAISSMAEAELNSALNDCVRSELIYQRGTPPRATFLFKHALIQDAAYDSLLKRRRAELHERIARAIQTHFSDAAQREPETIAHHYTAAGLARQAVPYWSNAGKNAMARAANREAVGHLSKGLEVLRSLPPSDEGESEEMGLLLALGEAQTRSGKYPQAAQSLEQAATKARELDSADTFARAALSLEEVSWQLGGSDLVSTPLLQEANRLLGQQDSLLKGNILIALARSLSYGTSRDECVRIQQQALALAHRLNDPLLSAWARSLGGGFVLNAPWTPQHLTAVLSDILEIARLVEESDDLGLLRNTLNTLYVSTPLGDMGLAMKAFDDLDRLATRHQRPFYLYCVMNARTALAMFQGRYERCEQLAREAFTWGQSLPGLDGTGAYSVQMFSLCREQGRLADLAPLVKHFIETTPAAGTWGLGLALIYAELGMTKEANAEFAKLATNDFAAIPKDATWLNSLGMLAEICYLLGDTEHAATLYNLLLPYERCNLVAPPLVACYGAVARQLGMLASTMKRWHEAEGHFKLAIELNERQGGRPYVAHAQQEYAQMLLTRDAPGDADPARSLLRLAVATARELGMNGLHNRAAACLEQSERVDSKRCHGREIGDQG